MGKLINVAELKQIQLQIMDYFHSWCREHRVTYFMTAGTLIGSLRHKGFIPWDDDIDVVMLREEYEKFVRDFPKSETGHFRLLSIETDSSCTYSYAKIYDDRTVFIEGDEKTAHPIGVNIDIFPLDNATDDFADAKKLKDSIKPYDKLLVVKQMSRDKRGLMKDITVFIMKAITGFISYHWLITHIIKKAKKYKGNSNSRYVLNAVIYAKGEREVLERKWFSEVIELEFEGRYYSAPIGADEYMRRLFGDYMQLPPENKRVSHHRFKAFFKD